MIRIASGSKDMDYEDWMPSKIQLNVSLMWNILQFNCNHQPQEMVLKSLSQFSATPGASREDMDDGSIIEIIATTSPEVTVDTADGGQAVPMPVYRGPVPTVVNTPGSIAQQDRLVPPTDNLMLDTTPWLWTDHAQLNNLENLGYLDTDINPGDTGGSAWWDLGNL